jgi:hypothetical protein
MGCGNGPLFKAARRLSGEFGLSVIPVRGKRAACRWKPYQERRPTEGELAQMMAAPGLTGFAVICGLVSGGLVVVDYDVAEAYEEWAGAHRALARQLPTVRTARGYQVYFRGPSHFVELEWGEYRGTSRQYVVAPPSRHPSGVVYEWVIPPGEDIPCLDDPTSAGLLPSASLAEPHSAKSKSTSKTKAITSTSSSLSHRYTPGGVDNTSVLSGEDVIAVFKRRGVQCRPRAWMLPDRVVNLARLHRPARAGQRHNKLFDYARALQGTNIAWQPHMLWGAFRQWWEGAHPVVRTKSELTSLVEFLDAYDAVRSPAGRLDVSRLAEEAADVPLPTAALRLPERARTLLRACVALQQVNGGATFFLTYQDAGRLLGACKRAGQYEVQRLLKGGFLERLTTGNNYRGEASCYRCETEEKSE